MKTKNKLLSLLLVPAICIGLSACADKPQAFEGMVMDSCLSSDYSEYYGTWIGEDNSVMTVELNDYGDAVRFELCDENDELKASGYIQSVPKYDADYFYNEHDGWAHRSYFNDDGTLQIDSFGTFAKASGDIPGENIGDIG